MSDTQWQEFLIEGENWQPADDSKIPLVFLYPGDTLLMMPGNHNVHAPVTLEDCGMSGGMFWDQRVLVSILEKIQDQIKAPGICNEELPVELGGILQMMQFRDDTSLQVKELCATICNILYCYCNGICGLNCPCRQRKMVCKLGCHSSSKKKICRNKT